MNSTHIEKHEMTIENIRLFCEQFPDNGITLAWDQMLDDDPDGEEYTVEDYQEEMEYQEFDHNLSHRDVTEIYNFFESEE